MTPIDNLKKLVYLGVFASLWLAPAAALAQDTGVAGSVSDATGAVLPGFALLERERVLSGSGCWWPRGR